MNPGQTSDAVSLGENWAVYRVVDSRLADPADFAKQQQDVPKPATRIRGATSPLKLFGAALDNRMKAEGKLKINSDNLKRMSTSSSS